MIPKNVGGYDRLARGVLAVVLGIAGLAVVATGTRLGTAAGIGLLAGSAGLGFNAVTQRCLGNHLLGIDTCSRDVES